MGNLYLWIILHSYGDTLMIKQYAAIDLPLSRDKNIAFLENIQNYHLMRILSDTEAIISGSSSSDESVGTSTQSYHEHSANTYSYRLSGYRNKIIQADCAWSSL